MYHRCGVFLEAAAAGDARATRSSMAGLQAMGAHAAIHAVRDDHGRTALALAATAGHMSVVACLLSEGVPADEGDDDAVGCTPPLHQTLYHSAGLHLSGAAPGQ